MRIAPYLANSCISDSEVFTPYVAFCQLYYAFAAKA